ncbi:hypothetical protein JTE90_002813 [Oedothorax gibbosus]|uniref:Uncharacterized protein n=1 Tax=Oedothorax gibbosus TaxID=931172 RepID=A0AAV6U276_9ARAC|nr:hypothetical protein JTE90_002813 [Oedothorax gibbosus]
MGLSTWHPRLWSPWHDPGLAWLGLLEGLVLPLLLFCRDAALGAALRRAFQRRSGALSPLVGDDGPFQMYFDKDHFRKRGTFGSVTPIGIITNYRRTPGGQQQQKSRSMRSKGGKYALPGLHGSDSVLPKKSASFLGGHAGEPLSKLSCADLTSLGMWREEEEEFYATMSDDFSTFSCKSGDDSALSEDLRDEDVYGGSFTTVANDDFEFHDTRPCGGEVRMKPALLSPDTPLPPPSRNTSFRENIRPKVPQVFPELPRPTTQLFVDLEEERKDPDLFAIPLADEEEKEPSTSTSPPDTPPQLPPTPKKPTSLSMNDLDLIHKRGPMDDLETTFILPVKSESTMSLYRLNTDQDVDSSLTPSRSETNVTNNGDSGFGSGAQSTNPVWSGFLCRKPSDPFWNMRKPSSSSVATTTTPTNKNNSPGVMHPRMRKIPWINAWKKLDENSRQQQQQTVANEQDGEEILGWKENLVYDANGALNSCAIDEELSDVSSPVAMQPSNFNNGDYNLNVFAQESGILMENAYGKIVRDDLGVQVNFYSKNDGVLKDPASCFQRNVEPTQLEKELFPSENHKSDYPNYRQSFGCDVSMSNPPLNNINKGFPNDNILCGIVGVRNDFKCEPRLNGGHYENLFGTKQNIFAQCDPLVERSKSKVADSGYHVDKRCGKDSCQLSAAKNNNFESVYGQLNKPEKFGFSKNVGRSPSKSKELRRRESDNRGNRVGIKRRESRTRSDPRPNLILETNACRSFAEFENKFGRIEKLGSDRPSVEIEMKNVNVKGELIHESRLPKLAVNRNPNSAKSKPDNNYNNKQNGGNVPPPTERVERRDSRGKDLKRTSVERKHSGRKAPTEHKDGCVLQQLERRVPQLSQRKESGLPVRVERRNSDRTTRNDPKAEKTTHENRIDRQGLWVNAIPFPGKEDEENGNSPPRKGSRQASRSPRKSNLPRRESSSNDNKARVRRKVSGNRARSEDPVGRVWGMRDPQKTKEDLPREDNIRDCERRLDQIVFCGKMNGNIDQQNGEVYPFETFQDNDARRQHLPTTRAALDDNENCRKLAITDFL